MNNIEAIKAYLSEHSSRIRLYDQVMLQVKALASVASGELFPMSGTWSAEEFRTRLHRYEEASLELLQTQALLAFCGEVFEQQVVSLPLRRLVREPVPQSGLHLWLALRWYPISLLVYVGGIAAVAARRYTNLKELLLLWIDRERQMRQPLLTAAMKSMIDFQEAFKTLPEHDRLFMPRSEYFFTLLRPILDTTLSLGTEYEACFDEFEILFTLEYAYQQSRNGKHSWGPPGRFGWKYEQGEYGSPYHSLVAEGKMTGSNWGPVKAGMFGGSLDSFLDIASKYSENLQGVRWR